LGGGPFSFPKGLGYTQRGVVLFFHPPVGSLFGAWGVGVFPYLGLCCGPPKRFPFFFCPGFCGGFREISFWDRCEPPLGFLFLHQEGGYSLGRKPPFFWGGPSTQTFCFFPRGCGVFFSHQLVGLCAKKKRIFFGEKEYPPPERVFFITPPVLIITAPALGVSRPPY